MERSVKLIERSRQESRKARIMIEQLEYNSDYISGCKIHDNQKQEARRLYDNFNNQDILMQILVGKTQIGKTGIIIALIRYYLEYSCIPPKNIFIITGLSSLEWLRQTRHRVQDYLDENVYHLGNIKHFVNKLKDLKNTLIFIDEVHIALQERQKISNLLKENLIDINYCLENDIKFIQISATPNSAIIDLNEKHVIQQYIRIPENYYSPEKLLNIGKVKQFKDLSVDNEDHIKEIYTYIQNLPYKMYHLFRIPTKNNEKFIRALKINFPSFNFETYYENDKEDINNKLDNEPINHTIILIKEKCRCSLTFNNRTYLGVLYERYNNVPDNSVIIQGFLGRMCGYLFSEYTICYTDIESIHRYTKLYENGFKYPEIPINTGTVKSQGKGKINSYKPTINNGIVGKIVESDEMIEPTIKRFKTQEEVYKYLESKGYKRYKFRSCDSNGYYTATEHKKTDVYSHDEVYALRRTNLGKSINYRVWPCYKDKNNRDTLEFWIIHY